MTPFWIIFTALFSAGFGFVLACVLGAANHQRLTDRLCRAETERAEAAYEASVAEAMLLASQAQGRDRSDQLATLIGHPRNRAQITYRSGMN